MPDARRHRGAHPQDGELFAPPWHPTLREAVSHFSWLLSHDYAPEAAIKLVGDHFGLRERQRRAVIRSSCTDGARRSRAAKRRTVAMCGPELAVDGYNVLITLESVLSGGVVLVGRDGACRDLASVHGTYRRVEETIPALRLVIDTLQRGGVRRVLWLLDKPVSNSARLKVLLANELDHRFGAVADRPEWDIALVDRPDAVLASAEITVATVDSVVLDRCRSWVDLPGELLRSGITGAWVVDMAPPPDSGL